ncbi:hypothetical protein DQ04_00101250 [Trypanosoma grayi]|uniref:hypothetical protein n=1 Tax=Trypanosoma grayi TaxID=71804 RepID=UPI0004F409C8|nr:hypothetical protein DQ04_00101250 [Trypanosoma grayi]KEG15358.1 hypothetical protein DQ04_00101250 [Trypanosoma grayi]
MSRGPPLPRHFKRLFPAGATLLRKLLVGVVALALLALVILLPPASSPLRTRVHHYHREEMRLRGEGRLQEVLLGDDTVEPCNNDRCGVAVTMGQEKVVELTVFIVFHRRLHERLYEGLAWPALLPSSVTDAATTPTRPVAAGTTTNTRGVIEKLLTYRRTFGRRNGNRIFFIATKEPLEHRYSPQMVEGRLLREWEMPGYAANTSFLQMYSAIITVYRSGIVGRPRTVAGEEWVAFLEYDMRIDQQLLHRIRRRILRQPRVNQQTYPHSLQQQLHRLPRCCIFYGASYNTLFLLNNSLGRQLLREYNNFFQTSFSLLDLPPVSATGAFVVPAEVLHRIAPFLESLVNLLVVNRSARRGLDATTPPASEGKRTSNALAGSPLEVMEAALALSLGLETDYVYVEVPIRHMTERELEELEDEHTDS